MLMAGTLMRCMGCFMCVPDSRPPYVLQLLGPLIHERDVYLAWSLKRSKAVNGCQRVVGVMVRFRLHMRNRGMPCNVRPITHRTHILAC